MTDKTIYDEHPNKKLREGVLKQRKLLGKKTTLLQQSYALDQQGKEDKRLDKALKKASEEYEEYTIYLNELVDRVLSDTPSTGDD